MRGQRPYNISLSGLDDLLDKNEKVTYNYDTWEYLGRARICLSWRPGNHLKIILPKRRVYVPLALRHPRLEEHHIFTTEGFLFLTDLSLNEERMYLGQVSFIGYSGFFRYPEIRGDLWQAPKEE